MAKTTPSILIITLFFGLTTLSSITSAEIVGSVVTNGHDCAQIGRDVLEKKGTAVDAAIASLFCEGLKLPQSAGLGGGFLMTIYDAKTNTAACLNARETAPGKADKDMYRGNATTAKKGILSVAVPGELRGYKEAYEKYGGGVPWKDLVQPSIYLLEKGILVTPYMEKRLKLNEDIVRNDPGLSKVYINKVTNKVYKTGERYFNKALLETLKTISTCGGDCIHQGPLTDVIVDEIQSRGGIISKEDLNNYKPKWEDPISVDLCEGKTLYTTPLPGSGAILAYILNILDGFIDKSSIDRVDTWQKVVESFKFSYGMRTRLGDDDSPEMKKLVEELISKEFAQQTRLKIFTNQTFQNASYYGADVEPVQDHGTLNICVLGPNGDAVAVTSTINLVFGSGILLPVTGIILNDEMDDFASPEILNENRLPPSKVNYIHPGKRPLSSMVPSLLVDEKHVVRMVIGAAGGTKITTSVALTILKHVTFGFNLTRAIGDKRLHHQLFPMVLYLENSYCQPDEKNLYDGLCKQIGHYCHCSKVSDGYTSVTAIVNDDEGITGNFDPRRQGEVAYLYKKPKLK